ncbi:sensor histidine kinase, partial [Anaerosporobacter sp.]
IIAESKRLEKLSKSLLLIADIREGELTKSVVSTEQLKSYVYNLFHEQLAEKQMRLEVNCEIETIEANEVLLQSLLGNLIENAIRACNEDGKVVVTFYSQGGPCLMVEDNGIGMEEDELIKIMEPFYRVDQARSRKNGGVGLGVTLCQQIVRLHQGEIRYESVINKGTKAIITFTT